MKLQSLLWLIIFSLSNLLHAQNRDRLFAIVASPIHVAGDGQTGPVGLQASPLDKPGWRNLTWPGLPLRAMAVSRAAGAPKLLVGGSEGILRPFINPTGWQLLTDWHLTEVLDLQVGRKNPRAIFAATVSGIYVSEDGGVSWNPRNTGLANQFVSSLLLDPNREGRILAGTEDGLYESTDTGHTWQPLALPRIAIRTMLLEPESWPGIFWVGTEYHGMFESYDGGKTFTPVDMDSDSLSVYALAGGGANAPIYAGLFERGLYMATSQGEDWYPIAGSEKLGTVYCILPMDDHQTVYAGTHENGVFRSPDRGQTWQPFGLKGAPVRRLMIGEMDWARP